MSKPGPSVHRDLAAALKQQAKRTGERSSHGRKNKSRIDANIAMTPHNLAGRMKSTVKALRIA